MSLDFGTLAVLFPLLLLLFGLGFTVTIDPYIQREHRRIMLVIVVLCLNLSAQNLWDNELFIRHKDLAWKKFLAAYGYSVRPVILNQADWEKYVWIEEHGSLDGFPK